LKILKNKTAAIAIALFFILSMTGSLMTASVKGQITALPGVAVGTHIPTFLYLNVGPNPIGVGQTVNVNAFFGSCIIDTEIPSILNPQNYNVTVTTPSGTTSTLTLAADKTGGGHVNYIPTTVGTYKFQAFYGGQAFTRPGWIGLTQDPAISSVVTLTVQQAPLTQMLYPFTPLPTNWWETPVSAENTQNWYKIMGPNLFQNEYNATTWCNPYTQPVLSAHVLWTKPWIAGGVAGGDLGGGEINGAYWTVRQYEQPFSPIVIDGKMWAVQQSQSSSTTNGIICVDLYTGATDYVINTTSSLSFGMAPSIDFPNGYGAVPYVIWTSGALTPSETGGHLIPSTGSQYNMYDGLTGLYICSIVNGTGLSNLHTDANGDVIGYYTNTTVGYMSIWTQKPFDTLAPNGTSLPSTPQLQQRVNITSGQRYLCEFNFTKALWNTMSTQGGLQISKNTAIDFRLGIMFAASIPTTLNGQAIYPALAIEKYSGTQVILDSYMYPGFYWTDGWDVLCAMNANTGAVTWISNYTYPTYQWLLPWQDTWSQSPVVTDNLILEFNLHNLAIQAFNVDTGNSVWTNTIKVPYGNGQPNLYDELAKGLGTTPVPFSYNGQVVLYGFGVDIWDINMTNGNIMWYTNTTNLMGPSGIETPYNVWPIWTAQSPQTMAPDVCYFSISHMYNPPMFHGGQILAVNMTTGQLIWKILSFPMTGQALAYGILLHLNGYDGQVWAYGKGPSCTTVTTSPAVTTTGGTIQIEGTVTDVSAGTTQEQQKFDFPNGVPCVSDASESAFMEYVYENQPAPTNTTGVPVTLTETDHNGNTYTIGTTRSNAMGAFGYTWTPPIEGNYTIVATFAGSNSYYGSAASTFAYAGPAAATTAPTTAPVQGFATTNDLMLGIVAIIVVMIISVAVMTIVLRKRP